jgi:HD-like signal output (HDOD) protein
MEIVRLTEQPRVNVRALKECLQEDPALICKVLRVVNSSLFGLPNRVSDLNQALALLGIKPLKLLVLGFSLPDALFAEVAARELQWYWTNTLTRAVAARLLSERLWRQPGDEPFIAGLLEDVGILVLLRELGAPYAKFLSGVIDERCDLVALERKTLGFDHVQMSAALFSRWQLPQKLIDAIAAPRQIARLARMPSPEGDLPQISHLAGLLAQLVGRRRLHVLPELLEAGEAYCALTKPQLTELIENLQPQVDQLAEVLALELTDGREYSQVFVDAHQQMAALTESLLAAASTCTSEDESAARLQLQTRELSDAMQSFLTGRPGAEAAPIEGNGASRSDESPMHRDTLSAIGSTVNSTLIRKLLSAAECCRQRRQELSLLILEFHASGAIGAGPGSDDVGRRVRRALGRACATFDSADVALIALSEHRSAAVLVNCERRAALATAQHTIRHLGLANDATSHSAEGLGMTLCVGVATAAVVPTNFDPARLVERAERCLAAASACGVTAVKSIEA